MAKFNVLGVLNRYLANDSTPGVLYEVEIFEADGTFNVANYKASYEESSLTTANANPVILDSAGKPDTGGEIWVNGDCDIRIKTSGGTEIDTIQGANPTDTATAEGNFNQVLNPSFESWDQTDPDSWTATRIGTVAVDTTINSDGTQCAKFVSAGSGGGSLETSGFIGCSEQISLLGLFKLYSSVVDVRNLVEFIWYDEDFTQLSTTTIYDESAANPLSFELKTKLATPPSTARYYKIKATGCHSSDSTPGSTWMDGFAVHSLVFTDIYSDQTIAGNKTLSGLTNFSGRASMSLGTGVALATTITLPTDGNMFHLTAGTGPIGDITHITGDGPYYMIVDVAATITHGAGVIECPAAVDLDLVADDIVEFIQDGTTWLISNVTKASGKSVAFNAGDEVQSVITSDPNLATGTTAIPWDNTTPQNTEGDQYITVAITPTKSTNKLIIEGLVWVSPSIDVIGGAVLFQDSTANCLKAFPNYTGGTTVAPAVIYHEMTAGTISSTTFKIRAGHTSGTTTFNGRTSAGYWNLAIGSHLRVREIEV